MSSSSVIKMSPIELKVSRSIREPIGHQPVAIGVPVDRGVLLDTTNLVLSAEAGSTLGCDVMTVTRWPDGSIKWLLLTFVLPPDHQYGKLLLKEGDISGTELGLQTLQTDSTFVVSGSEFRLEFDCKGDLLFPAVHSGRKELWKAADFKLQLIKRGDNHYKFAKQEFTVENAGSQSVSCRIDGQYVDDSGRPVLNARIVFSIQVGGVLSVRCEVHNPERARHVNGLWDLGDPGSVHFEGLSLNLCRGEWEQVELRPSIEHGWTTLSDSRRTTLFQASSGGDHWDSPVHVDATGKTNNSFQGFRVLEEDNSVVAGERAQPVIRVSHANGSGFLVAIREFWQNFPKSLDVFDKQLELGLFPVHSGEQFELQGGERKGHEILFSLTDEPNGLDWLETGSEVTVDVSAYIAADVFRYCTSDYNCPRYQQFVAAGLDATSGFVAKRELLDEYGWRHYGDIYADHETLYHTGAGIFVSHYNNQYDPLYGFARQYVLTGDTRWYRLMVALARHVLDIDIYRTVADRAEYNHGLFWHTDHYKKAHTCTHRTYSKAQYPVDWTGVQGGGPGPEHCYTTGLLYYYWLTGDEDAASAVVGLAEWISCYYEGTGTILEQLKSSLSKDLRQLVSLVRGKKQLRYRYPFDRGVGNYIRALIDSFEVTEELQYLNRAEAVIAEVFGPYDDLALRNLDDPENTWFYTVLLQEIIRYLDVKRELNQFDQAFDYARKSVLYYARWMAEHESPYLSKPDQLEFPNDTWVAQDIRKANVLYAAYRYAIDDRTILLERARYFRDYVLDSLEVSETRHYARIQILLLQNHGPSGFMDVEREPYTGVNESDSKIKSSCYQTVPALLATVLKSWGRCIVRFSARREIKWVKTRLG